MLFTQDFTDTIHTIVYHIDQNFPPEESRVRQGLAVAEEAGEAVGAIRRYLGMARRDGGIDDVRKELADVIITAAVTMAVFDIDMDAAIRANFENILTRGWKHPRQLALTTPGNGHV